MDQRTLELILKYYTYDPDTGIVKKVRKLESGKDKIFDVGSINSDGYVCIYVYGKTVNAHRVAYALYYGKRPDGEIDHINGIRTDNRIKNLRCVTKTENQRNRKLHKKNRFGISGVFWRESRLRWEVSIGSGGQRIFLGRYKSLLDACAARKSKENELCYHKNHGRP